ncbi:type II toxin-antitoxin system PemK/MazF family toxin [bacterium]|nr:type II toxin-antitoxin system PemK/MazF family toxin [bacterium]
MQRTKSTTIYRKWDIVLVRFPFTDYTGSKKRPALIISPNEFNKLQDVLITFVTSRLEVPPRIGDYVIVQWQKAGLPKPSLIRMKFATIDKSIISKRLGHLAPKDVGEFRKVLIDFIDK